MTEITKKDFEKLNLRVGKIKAVKPHPKTKDYVLLISLGPAGTEKQLVADLKEGYTKEELVGKQVLFVQNMEPITVKGVESIGLLLVTHKNEKPVLVQPEKKVETGMKASGLTNIVIEHHE
ncbi:methionine--tRNA ligase [Candidatus Woesearchaeota archaeon]|nr:methionine--tRNA ligase [Candidatus Woesearchaeota archaeon]